jgi:hypothetical protein
MNELAKELLSVLTDEMIERRGNVMLFHYGCCDGILIAEMRVYYTTYTSHNEVILSNYAACRGEGTKELKRALEEAISKNIKIYFHIYEDNPEQQKLLYRAEIKSYFISKDDTIFISNIENLDEIKNPFGKTIINNLKGLDTDTLQKILKIAGISMTDDRFDKDAMDAWHAEFEKNSPEQHKKLLSLFEALIRPDKIE